MQQSVHKMEPVLCLRAHGGLHGFVIAARRRSNYKMPAWLQHQEKWDLRLSYSHCGRQPPDTKISLIFTINKTNDEFPTTTHTNSQGSVQTCPHYYNMSKYFVVVVDVVVAVVVLMLILTFKPKEKKKKKKSLPNAASQAIRHIFCLNTLSTVKVPFYIKQSPTGNVGLHPTEAAI